MRKFLFGLEGVARLREAALRERTVDLARAQEAVQEAERVRREREGELKFTLRESPHGAVLHVRHLLERDAELRRLRAELMEQERLLASRKDQVNTRREHLMHARQDSEAVEKLRQRRYREFLTEVKRDEQKTTDEAASRGTRRKAA